MVVELVPADAVQGPTVEDSPDLPSSELPHEVRTTGRVPVKSWATQIEDLTWKQAEDLSRLPFATHHVALMPDAHPGYGMPIGGVLFADKAVVPYAVGVDIGCGVALIETAAHVGDLDLRAYLDAVARGVPVGNGPRGGHGQDQKYPKFQPPDGTHADDRLLRLLDDSERQLGTLGGGNHFLEVQADEEDRVWVMLHSGSRRLGKLTCDLWHKRATELDARWHVELPHRDLAFLPWDDDSSREYWNDMTVALAWAEENRRRMADVVVSQLGLLGFESAQVLDVHHNYAAWERHYGKHGIVHRKGAVRAARGQVVLIPGSMGTASYVAEGLGFRESFETCQHGAGRARARGATTRTTTLADMDAQMGDVVLVTPDRAKVIDEAPVAYKDVEEVMRASSAMVRPVRRHLPLGVLKG